MTPSERRSVVDHYAPKIKIIALRLKAKLPASVELVELLSAGALGLVEALGRFRADRGIKFETFAEARVKGAMLDELRKLDIFSRSKRARMKSLDETRSRFEREHGRTPTVLELAELTGIAPKEIEDALEALTAQYLVSLDELTDHFHVQHKGNGVDEPYAVAVKTEIVQRLAGLVEELTEREQLVLSLYYAEELTMRETAEVMGITEGRVSQLHTQALLKLKDKFKARHGLGSGDEMS